MRIKIEKPNIFIDFLLMSLANVCVCARERKFRLTSVNELLTLIFH